MVMSAMLPMPVSSHNQLCRPAFVNLNHLSASPLSNGRGVSSASRLLATGSSKKPIVSCGRLKNWRKWPRLPGSQIGRAHVELQSLMRISYAVFCLKKKTQTPRREQTATDTAKRENNKDTTTNQNVLYGRI